MNQAVVTVTFPSWPGLFVSSAVLGERQGQEGKKLTEQLHGARHDDRQAHTYSRNPSAQKELL